MQRNTIYVKRNPIGVKRNFIGVKRNDTDVKFINFIMKNGLHFTRNPSDVKKINYLEAQLKLKCLELKNIKFQINGKFPLKKRKIICKPIRKQICEPFRKQICEPIKRKNTQSEDILHILRNNKGGLKLKGIHTKLYQNGIILGVTQIGSLLCKLYYRGKIKRDGNSGSFLYMIN